jgi:flagellar hook-associated protein 3
MSIIGIPSTRISDQFSRQALLQQVQGDQVDLLRLESQVSTGQKFQLPSEAPAAAMRVTSLQQLLARKAQIQSNLTTNQSYLTATDTAMSQVSGMIADVRAAALGAIGTTATDQQRQAAAQQVQQALQQLVDTGNQNFRGRYLFAGSETATKPFRFQDGNLVRYDGNESRLSSYGNVDLQFDTNVQGNEAFGAISDPVRGSVDLNPAVTRDTRLADLFGGRGIPKGSIAVSDGASTQIVDLSQAETVGDVVAMIHANPPAGSAVNVQITPTGFTLQLASGNLTITDVGSGTTAAELGILTERGVGTNPVASADLNPNLSPTTRLADVLGSKATAVLRAGGSDNDMIFTAGHNGAGLNGATISVIDDPAVHAGSETVDWNPVAKTLTIHIEDGYTAAQDIVNAVNGQFQTGAIPFQAELDPLDGSQGGTGLVRSAATPSVVTAYGSGTDLDQGSGLQIVNGGATPYTIDLSKAVTVDDLLATLNASPAGVLAEVNARKTGIDVRSRVSGGDFAIGENGGTTAAQLGLRTFTGQTRLADLNFGRGVADYQGAANGAFPADSDFTITRNDGVSFTIDIHGAKTVGDVLNLINTNAVNSDPSQGVALEARLAANGNGIELVDRGTGPGHLTVTRNPMSTAAIDLGLVPKGQDSSTATADVLTGADANPQETEGLLTALARLQHGLTTNDLEEMSRAMAALDQGTVNFNFSRAELGTRQQGLDALQQQLDTETTDLQAAMSADYDVDMAEAVTQLTAKQVAYEASLRAIGQISQFSLLNFI